MDPDARHAHKTRERRQDGFKAHLVVEPDTGLATAVRLTKTNGAANSTAAVGADLNGLHTRRDRSDRAAGSVSLTACLQRDCD